MVPNTSPQVIENQVVYVLRCGFDPEYSLVPREDRCFRMKSSHGLGDAYEELPVSMYSPRSWSRVAVCVGEEEQYPLYVELAREADEIYYVGRTTDFDRRLSQHVKGQGGQFTQQMHVREVVYNEKIQSSGNTEWYESSHISTVDLADRREDKLGTRLNVAAAYARGGDQYVNLDRVVSFAHFDTNTPSLDLL